MPLFSCDHNARGEAFNEFAIEVRSPGGSGSVLVDVRYTWDGTSAWPNCNGPITFIRTRNTSQENAWALLPDKRKGSPWVLIAPGTDSTITAKGTLSNLGLTEAVDAQRASITFTAPA